jgi:ATP-dependent Lon protease
MIKLTQFIKLFDHLAMADRRETLSKDVMKQTENLFKKQSEVRIRVKLTRERLAEIEAHLRKKFPSFNEATDAIFNELMISLHSASKGVYFWPILLLGPPGTGKTHYARELSELLGLGFEKVDLAATTAGMVLVGTSSQWGNSKPGLVASHLLQNRIANFVLFLDEIDKADNKFINGGDVNNSLLTLLEPETAKEFQDEFVQVPMDASNICIILTANEEKNIDEPILSRLKKVRVTEPTLEQLRQIAPFALENIIKHLEVDSLMTSTLDSEALDALQMNKVNVRQLNEVLREAMGQCLKEKATQLSATHITIAIERTLGITVTPEAKPKSTKKLH